MTKELIEEIQSRADIVQFISRYVPLEKTGNSYYGYCPFHNEKAPTLMVNPARQIYYCFGCGEGGNIFSFLMQYSNYSFEEAVREIAAYTGIRIPEERITQEMLDEVRQKKVLYDINNKAARYFYDHLHSPNGKKGMEYLKKRGVSEQSVMRFGLGYAGRHSDLYQHLKKAGYSDEQLKESGLFYEDDSGRIKNKFWNRVMYPIMDVNNRVIGFGGRVLEDVKPKYLNSPETMIFDKSRNLYGLQIARLARKPNLIICEGYMDVIAMHQAGFNNAVASLGTSLTAAHCCLMKQYVDEVLVIYDMDDAGVNAAMRAIPMLRKAGLQAKVVDLRPHKDPDEFIQAEGKEAFQQRLDNALDSRIFEIHCLHQQYNSAPQEDKKKYLDKLMDAMFTV